MDSVGPATPLSQANGKAPLKSPAEDHPSLVPPYWQHRRYESYSSVGHLKPTPITLEDHTEEEAEERSLLWAKTVTIDDHVLVQGTIPNIGNYVVWRCNIELLDVSHGNFWSAQVSYRLSREAR